MKNPKFRFWLICSALWMCFIFFQSSLSAQVSATQSKGLLAVLNHFWPELTHDLLRKIAHFAEYFILGCCTLGMFFNTKDFKVSKPLLFSLLTAVADETLQIYVDGRSSELLDVWIDLAGALVGVLIFWAIMTIRKK
ncbi:MAG: VanZ family protein [Oscillospiraceae bacterium]|nr:VanZ family protein [Oscillospiraceae bacterium]